MTPELVYLVAGGALLLAVVLPNALSRVALSAPIVLLLVGVGIGLLPAARDTSASPIEHRELTEHLSEICVIVALMGVGLALDRPLRLRDRSSWRTWDATWRMLAIGMPLTIAGVALLGWWAGLAPAAALLLGAALAPTDPVLASDVQVGGPTVQEAPSERDSEEVDEEDEVRFALTSEAGLNDGLAFPFVWAAILWAQHDGIEGWGLRWVAWDLVGRSVIGVAVGVSVGWLLAKLAFRAPRRSLRLAETGEPLLALAAVLLSYGATEAVNGYGFLAVFTCAMALRAADPQHEFHGRLHGTIERLERLLTVAFLLLFGVGLTNGLLDGLTWAHALIAIALVLVVRPVAGWVALQVVRPGSVHGELDARERGAIAFFGIRGVGSVYYLAFATGHADFADLEGLWATVAFAIMVSVLVHGVASTPVMSRIERHREATA